jgi:two-component system response regulator AlgR
VRILVVDDEPNARDRLIRLVGELGDGHEVVGEAADGEHALSICTAREPDLVFLDIEMPGLGGLEAAERLAGMSPPPAVILVTAYPEFALEAFEHRVQDYLVKPVRLERLRASLERVRVPTRAQRDQIPRLGRRPSRRSRLTARYRGGVEAVAVERVIYLQADQKYVLVRHDDGSLLVEESLKSLEEEFPDILLRIHRSALVARDRIEALEKGTDGAPRVRLRGCAERLPVSRRHLAAVRRWLRS